MQAAVGQRIRDIRSERGLTQDALASALHRHGVGWNRSMLAKVERGERRPLLEELLLVAWALSVPVSELLPAEGALVLTEEATIDARAARVLLSGWDPAAWATLQVGQLDVPFHESLRQRHGGDVGAAHPVQVQAPAFAADLAADEEAERRAAKRLKVDPAAVAAAAHKAWGRTLSTERERRVSMQTEPGMSDRSRQALRGHVTRQLEKELAPILEEDK